MPSRHNCTSASPGGNSVCQRFISLIVSKVQLAPAPAHSSPCFRPLTSAGTWNSFRRSRATGDSPRLVWLATILSTECVKKGRKFSVDLTRKARVKPVRYSWHQ